MRKFLYGLVGLVVVVVAAAWIVPGLIDWNGFKPDVVAEVKKATGRDMRIEGDLDLALLPTPRLSVAGVRIANIDGATAQDMIRLEALSVRVHFRPLFSGRIEVESVALIKPVIELETLKDGRANWVIGAPATAAQKSGSDSPKSDSAEPDAIRLDSLRIRDGTVTYRDATSGTVERIERVNAVIAAATLSGPFRIDGSLTVRGTPFRLDGTLGNIAVATPAVLRLGLSIAGTGTDAQIVGALANARQAHRVTGKLNVKSPDLAKLSAALAVGDPATGLPAWLAQNFSLSAELDASAKALSIDNLDIRLGETAATGGVSATLGEKVSADIALNLKHIDIEKWQAMRAAVPKRSDTGSTGTPAPATPANQPAEFQLPKNVSGSLNVGIEAVSVMGGRLRDIKLAAALDDGEVTLNELSIRLPGEAEVALAGFISSPGGKPAFEGSVEGRADNLRALLEWLKIDVADVPADRLRKFSVNAKLRGDRKQAQVSDINIRFDASRVRGGVTYAFRKRPAFGARFNIDQFNVDAYAPPRRRGTTKKTATRPARSATPQQNETAAPLAVLNDFDANVNLRVGTLNYRRTPIQEIAFDGTLSGGKLTLRRARIGNLAGTSATVNGTLAGFDRLPSFKGKFTIVSKDLTGLLRVAQIEPPVPPRRLGRLKLSGRADASADRTTLDSTLEVTGGKVRLAGSLTGLQANPRYDLRLDANHPDVARLARLFGSEIGPKGAKLGPIGFTARARGTLQSTRLDTRLKAAGVDATFSGKIADPISAPAIEGKFAASHPNYAGLMRALDPTFRSPRQNLGAVKLSSGIKGNLSGVKLEKFGGRIGPMKFNGDVDTSFTGPRPKVTASLKADQIPVDVLFPPKSRSSRQKARASGRFKPASAAAGRRVGAAAPAAKPRATAGATGQRFSPEPLDLSMLGDLDADLRLDAQLMTYRNIRIDRPRVAITLQDRVLKINELTGKMFDGAFDMKGQLSGAGTPSLKGTLKVDRANVGRALFEAANFDIAKGQMNFDLAISGVGRSEHALVSSLDGKGQLSVRNGSVKGFNLRAVSDRLKQLNRATDFLGLLGSAMGGGTTAFSALDGTFTIKRGVIRTNDLRMIADAGQGNAAGIVDLGRWHMDMAGQFRLTEHADAPPFDMAVRGPIDQPNRIFRFDKLQGYLVQRGIGSLLQKVIPGVKQEAAPAQPSTQPQIPQQIKPEDLLRGLLKGLNR